MNRCTALLLLISSIHAAEPDTRLVRETAALTPEQEKAALHVPSGFEVQLFASEPMINKPINLAFDARGRLWVSSTVEYPYAADKSRWSDAQGTRVKDSRDAIKILEDTDGDGKADKVTDFADGLNIPTGVLPWHKPEHKVGCIAWSIPNIWYFADTDGDDKADVREVIFGPLGYEKDTHGMCSSFRLGLDGWVYATHGFNNTSQFKAKDGSTLELHSGNVFRFRPDGSRVEPWTHGQVNPFGLCWDRYGNLYSADCHSSPIYQLIRGAHYPSFGKPHDGLGFAPVMCQHTHGSTGICGIVYIDGGVWGPEWDDHTFVGNVVTSKVNHDKVTFTGSTPKANERPDFLTSDDPWFRPVDLQLGPDNALYIADFYNKIIGHYEVPLDHPGRDKERGRIWRVVKKDSVTPADDFNTLSAKRIVEELGHPNLVRRHLALREVKMRGTKEWLPELFRLFESGEKMTALGDRKPQDYRENYIGDFHYIHVGWEKSDLRMAHSMWALSYLGERFLVSNVLRNLHTGGSWTEDNGSELNGLLMSHAAQVIGSYDQLHPWEKWNLGIAFDGRGSAIGRASTQALQQRPDFLVGDPNWHGIMVKMLVQMTDDLLSPPGPENELSQRLGDTAYVHSLRVLLRDVLSQPGWLQDSEARRWMGKMMDKPWFVEVLQAVPTADAASFSFQHLQTDQNITPASIKHVVRHIELASIAKVIAFAKEASSFAPNAAVPKAPPSSAQDKVLGSPEATTPPAKQSAEGATLDSAPPPATKDAGSRGSAFQASDQGEATSAASVPRAAPWAKEGRAVGAQTMQRPSAISLLQAISDGLSERGAAPPPELLTWAQELAEELLVTSAKQPAASWISTSDVKWTLKLRRCSDGMEIQVLQSMAAGGGDEEGRTGILRSKDFPAPAKLALWINGHRGFPKAEAHDKNLVRVVEAKSGKTLASAFPPRSDVCQHVELDLANHVGKAVRMEIVDGDDGKAYAWLGITRIEPPLVSVNDFQTEDTTRDALKQLAIMLQHSAPAALREKLAAYLPLRPAPPPLPVSPEQRKQLDALIASRLAAFAKAKPDLEVGSNVFKMNCAACHQIKGEGGLIGPQLDGIGARGPERLCEDILDPNRNVDAHFHLHTLTMKDGSTFAGFLKAELGQIQLLADAAGKEHRISKKDILKTEVTPISLMPPTFGESLDEATFMDLLGYLLSEKAAK